MAGYDAALMLAFRNSLLDKGWRHLGSGRHRNTYGKDGKNIVIKIPKDLEGAKANVSEFKIWNRYKRDEFDHRGFSLARCKLLFLKNHPLIAMEKVEPLGTPERLKDRPKGLPTWCYNVDCYQVGYTKQNKIVAFDYSCHKRYWPTDLTI